MVESSLRRRKISGLGKAGSYPERSRCARSVRQAWPAYKSVFDRYGKEIYALYCPTASRAGTEAAVTAFLDLLFEERGYQPLASSLASYESIRGDWFEHLMPGIERPSVADLLSARRYVIIQGPAGDRQDNDGHRSPSRRI